MHSTPFTHYTHYTHDTHDTHYTHYTRDTHYTHSTHSTHTTHYTHSSQFTIRHRANILLHHLYNHPLQEPRKAIVAYAKTSYSSSYSRSYGSLREDDSAIVADDKFDAFIIAAFDTIVYCLIETMDNYERQRHVDVKEEEKGIGIDVGVGGGVGSVENLQHNKVRREQKEEMKRRCTGTMQVRTFTFL